VGGDAQRVAHAGRAPGPPVDGGRFLERCARDGEGAAEVGGERLALQELGAVGVRQALAMLDDARQVRQRLAVGPHAPASCAARTA
jgi:hypothetical protein